jgi:bifunctional DNase/RNase
MPVHEHQAFGGRHGVILAASPNRLAAPEAVVKWALMAKVVEMTVDSIRVHMQSGQHVVILKEKQAERYLPIWIGIYEANAIALKITGITPERPITHDLMANILGTAELRLTKIVVTSLTDEVFFARLFIGSNGKEMEVDARPSDAIALAVRLQSPIFVSSEVLDKAGVLPDTPEDEEKLSVFKELVNSMDLPDLGNPPAEPQG